MAQVALNTQLTPGVITYTVPAGNRFIGSAQANGALASIVINGGPAIQLGPQLASGATTATPPVSAICLNAGDVVSATASGVTLFGQLFNP